jgi:PPOX class probable F420-dependent enzyme
VTGEEARRRFASASVARLATVGADGRPHVVPIVFAVEGDTIYSAVDQKPKRTTKLRRLANIEANPKVSVLVDHYEDDWQKLWWVRADGRAQVLDASEANEAIDRLAERYEQYVAERPAGPVLAIEVERWSGWSAEQQEGDRTAL